MMKLQCVSILLFVFFLSGCESMFIRPEKLQQYNYEKYDLQITEVRRKFFHLTIKDRFNTTPIKSKLYVRYNNDVYSLDSLPEKAIVKAYGKEEPLKDIEGNVYTMYYRDNTTLVFIDGKIVHFDINQLSSEGEVGPEFSTSPEGPFYRIPIRKKQVIELFGEPNEIKQLNRL